MTRGRPDRSVLLHAVEAYDKEEVKSQNITSFNFPRMMRNKGARDRSMYSQKCVLLPGPAFSLGWGVG
jgi:hypothetical protein